MVGVQAPDTAAAFVQTRIRAWSVGSVLWGLRVRAGAAAEPAPPHGPLRGPSTPAPASLVFFFHQLSQISRFLINTVGVLSFLCFHDRSVGLLVSVNSLLVLLSSFFLYV